MLRIGPCGGVFLDFAFLKLFLIQLWVTLGSYCENLFSFTVDTRKVAKWSFWRGFSSRIMNSQWAFEVVHSHNIAQARQMFITQIACEHICIARYHFSCRPRFRMKIMQIEWRFNNKTSSGAYVECFGTCGAWLMQLEADTLTVKSVNRNRVGCWRATLYRKVCQRRKEKSQFWSRRFANSTIANNCWIVSFIRFAFAARIRFFFFLLSFRFYWIIICVARISRICWF